jgi:hypothetical protein
MDIDIMVAFTDIILGSTAMEDFILIMPLIYMGGDLLIGLGLHKYQL